MASRSRAEVVVYLDATELGPRRPIGVLSSTPTSSPVISFAYARSWLDSRDAFAIDPQLPLIEHEQYVRDGVLPGIFADIAPDRWGRTLMQRREALAAREEGRRARTLNDWDHLIGVSDVGRMGAIRLAPNPRGDTFIDDRDHDLAVPPMARLRELEHGARELDRMKSLPAEDETTWLKLLLAPGSSLGGARPKANYADEDGNLWIAKFPSARDVREMGAWEYLLADLAAASGIDVAEHRLLSLGGDQRTFAARRFDRVGTNRRLFASAMTLTGKRDGDEASYLDVAMAVADHGSPGAIADDLEQLFRRVTFNVLVSNRDDHLRNHGFLRTDQGWRLAPAFDLNPTPEKLEHGLAINEAERQADITLVRETAEWYRVRRPRAGQIIDEVRAAVAVWKDRARDLGLSRDEIDLVTPAFEAAA